MPTFGLPWPPFLIYTGHGSPKVDKVGHSSPPTHISHESIYLNQICKYSKIKFQIEPTLLQNIFPFQRCTIAPRLLLVMFFLVVISALSSLFLSLTHSTNTHFLKNHHYIVPNRPNHKIPIGRISRNNDEEAPFIKLEFVK